MARFRGRGPLNDQQARAVSEALNKAFQDVDRQQDSDLRRLIDKMRDFEESGGGEPE